MEYGRVETVLSSKLRRTPHAADRKTANVADSLWELGGGGHARRPLPLAPCVTLGRGRHLRACV